MKKELFTIFLSALLFAGCGSAAAPAAESKTDASSAASSAAAEETETEAEACSAASETEEAVSTASESLNALSPVSDSEAIAASSSEGEAKAATLADVFADIQADVQPGTAGASLKAAKAAAELMDFCYTTDLTAEELVEQTKVCYQSADDQEMLKEQMNSLTEAVSSFKDGSGEGDLIDSGTESSYPWDDAAYEKADAILALFAQN